VNDFLLGVAVALAIVGAAAVAGYFVLRRWFERTSRRVADDLGRVLADLSARTVAGQTPRRAAAAAPRGPSTAPRGYTHLGAYAAAKGIPEAQARQEFADSIERLARLTDAAVRVPVIGPVGLDAVLGLFPVAGDVASAGIAVLIIARSLKYGVPPEIIARMLANVLIDVLMGAVPVVGDLADVWFRANLRNLELLREFLGAEARDTIDITATRVS
jgi:hypothetical protein